MHLSRKLVFPQKIVGKIFQKACSSTSNVYTTIENEKLKRLINLEKNQIRIESDMNKNGSKYVRTSAWQGFFLCVPFIFEMRALPAFGILFLEAKKYLLLEKLCNLEDKRFENFKSIQDIKKILPDNE